MSRFYVFYNTVDNPRQSETLYFRSGGEANRVYVLLKDQGDINFIEIGKEIIESGLPICQILGSLSK